VRQEGKEAVDVIHDQRYDVTFADWLSWTTTPADGDVSMRVSTERAEVLMAPTATVRVGDLLTRLGMSPPTACTLSFAWTDGKRAAGTVMLFVRAAGECINNCAL
jgi:hypothetical protein